MEIPERMKKFPLFKGFPIHFTVFVGPDGSPDFKVVHHINRLKGLFNNLCAMCGEKMEPPYAFIGGPKCMEHHHFVDGPMHCECATYAAKTCPYLSNADYSDSKVGPKHIKEVIKKFDNVDSGRPDKMGLGLTSTYKVVMTGEEFRAVAGEWLSVDWDIMPKRT